MKTDPILQTLMEMLNAPSYPKKCSKNIIALRTLYKNGDSYLYGATAFYPGNDLTEKVALAVIAYKAKEELSSGTVSEVRFCYVNCEWNFEVKEDLIYDEFPVTAKECDKYIDTFDTNSIPVAKDIPVLEVLPDCGWYNIHLTKKLNKIRKAGKCIDWKKQNSNTEWDNAGWWYLHGRLQDTVGFDKAIILNATAAGITEETVDYREIRGNKCISYKDVPYRVMRLNNIVRCKTIGVNGDCLGFFYIDEERDVLYDRGTFKNWRQRGYVVQTNDKHGVLQAYHGYLMKDLH